MRSRFRVPRECENVSGVRRIYVAGHTLNCHASSLQNCRNRNYLATNRNNEILFAKKEMKLDLIQSSQKKNACVRAFILQSPCDFLYNLRNSLETDVKLSATDRVRYTHLVECSLVQYSCNRCDLLALMTI